MAHILSRLDRELAKLDDNLKAEANVVASQLLLAMNAIALRNNHFADRVIEDDVQVDNLRAEIETQAIGIQLRYGPKAIDQRQVFAAAKIAINLEFIGDCATNLVEWSSLRNPGAPREPARMCERMGKLGQTMIEDMIDAYLKRDAQKAMAVWLRVDRIYSDRVAVVIPRKGEPMEPLSHNPVLFMARDLKRIRDLMSGIFQAIHFLRHGKPFSEFMKTSLTA
jgi:phosphate transport system protein